MVVNHVAFRLGDGRAGIRSASAWSRGDDPFILDTFGVGGLHRLSMDWLENDYRRAYALYNARVHAAGIRQRDPAAAIDKLIEPLQQFSAQFRELLAQLGPIRAKTSAAAQDLQPGELPLVIQSEVASRGMSILTLATDQINVAEQNPSNDYPAYVVRQLQEFISEFPALLEEDLKNGYERAGEFASRRSAFAEEADKMVITMTQRVDDLAKSVEKERADINRLSGALSFRERAMFQWYDVNATRGLASAAVLLSIAKGVSAILPSFPGWMSKLTWAVACLLIHY